MIIMLIMSVADYEYDNEEHDHGGYTYDDEHADDEYLEYDDHTYYDASGDYHEEGHGYN